MLSVKLFEGFQPFLSIYVTKDPPFSLKYRAHAQKIKALCYRLQPVDTDPMLNFHERDLLAFVERAGFGEVHLELKVDIGPFEQKRS